VPVKVGIGTLANQGRSARDVARGQVRHHSLLVGRVPRHLCERLRLRRTRWPGVEIDKHRVTTTLGPMSSASAPGSSAGMGYGRGVRDLGTFQTASGSRWAEEEQVVRVGKICGPQARPVPGVRSRHGVAVAAMPPVDVRTTAHAKIAGRKRPCSVDPRSMCNAENAMGVGSLCVSCAGALQAANSRHCLATTEARAANSGDATPASIFHRLGGAWIYRHTLF